MPQGSSNGAGAKAAFMLAESELPRSLNVLGERITVLAGADRTGGLELFRQRGDVGQGPPPHAHGWDETFYIVSGEIEISAGDESRRLGPGSVAHVPAGVMHWFRFLSEVDMVSVTSPAGASRLFAAIDAANPSGPPDMDAVVAAVQSFGVTLGSH